MAYVTNKTLREREREREGDRQTDRQTDRQRLRERERDRQTDRQTDRDTEAEGMNEERMGEISVGRGIIRPSLAVPLVTSPVGSVTVSE